MTNRFRALSIICAAVAIVAGGAEGAAAQDWGWDGGYGRGPDQRPPYGEPGGGPYGQPGYGQRPVYGQQAPVYGQPGYGSAPSQGSANPRCRDLEVQLTGGATPASSDQLPRIDADMRQADADFRRAQGDADRANCYDDMFLFGRSLKRTPRCIELDQQVQTAKSTLAQLKAQRDAIMRGTSPRGRHDDIIAELARNRCGDQYVREHEAQRSRSSSIFSFFSAEEEPGDTSRSTSSWWGGGGSAYRTLCVRECDGFYFPVSTATTESKFPDDEAKCHTQCAAPAELYYHRTDQDVEQMVSLRGAPYSQMPNAFRNRKAYIRGCSCNASEYSREEIAKSEEALKTAKRADASAGGGKPPAAGSDAAFARRIGQAVQNAPSQPASPPAQSAPAAPPANAPWTPGVEAPPPAANPAQ